MSGASKSTKKFSLAGATAPTAESPGLVPGQGSEPAVDTVAQDRPAPPGGVPTAPLAAFWPDPRNHRTNLGNLKDLAARMAKHGQLQPVVAVSADRYRPKFPEVEVPDDRQFVVIMGGRRLAAAPLAPLDELKYTTADHLLDYDDYREAALDENWRREDLTCLDEARILAEFLVIDGTQQKVADRVGRSQPYVAQRLGLLDLVTEAHDAIDAGQIPFREARKLSALKTPEEQRAAVVRLVRAAAKAAAEDEGEFEEEAITAVIPPSPKVPTRKSAAGMLTRYRQAHGPRAVAELLRGELAPEDLAELVAALTEPAEAAEAG
jgi:ParB family chromosome partitioning protein